MSWLLVKNLFVFILITITADHDYVGDLFTGKYEGYIVEVIRTFNNLNFKL